MELSSRIEYALMALMELAAARQRGASLSLSEIARRQVIPDRYLEKILANLRLSGIVQSQRGARGGYILTRSPQQITLPEIIRSLSLTHGGPVDARNDLSNPMTLERQLLHEIWQEVRQEHQEVLEQYTLADICQRRDTTHPSNPMYYI
ncbi:hypothetical protein BST81_16975 [Leptolyngbya sp. 'hensonii']|uniref:RrF2 family transcriptional regulator n=1 Tax=Leptolyngbya sp. 'hensonii' TaxID=1922337 RepID=UPI0009502CC4|nr:Rrf2 family transcriptional regulator [Leptolyngbya sp. 'hensonii']OLP17055.1 hypothetical protein BST81_16975 [Leptolyngbya sp. 'hensonii']